MARHRSTSGVSHTSSDAEVGLGVCLPCLRLLWGTQLARVWLGKGLVARLALLCCSRVSLGLERALSRSEPALLRVLLIQVMLLLLSTQ
jgi:hypothetical protein